MKSYGIKISHLVFALLVIAAGVLLFAFNAGLLPIAYKSAVFSWPMLLMAIGFACLFSCHKWFSGLILMLVGGFFLLPKLDIDGRLEFITQNGWAILLIAAGIFILCKALFRSTNFWDSVHFHHHSHHWNRRRGVRFSKNWYAETGFIDRNHVFGGYNEKLDIKDFKGGDINCVFGGVELDLTDSELAEGVHTLELNSVFGGVVLYVPLTWNIEIRQNQFFGSLVDSRPKRGFQVDENRRLIIEANSVFGGGEIKCK